MNEAEFQARKLALLLDAYTNLNRLYAAPGERSHMLAYSIRFVERQIREICK